MSATTPEEIRRRLVDAFAPTLIEITDEGDKHIGHVGEGQGHFHVRIESAAFAGLSPLKRHRLVYAAVSDLMDHGIHALSIDAGVPQGTGPSH